MEAQPFILTSLYGFVSQHGHEFDLKATSHQPIFKRAKGADVRHAQIVAVQTLSQAYVNG